MEGKLEIGQLAMIIGCRHPENSWVIGNMVTVEAILSAGSKMPAQYMADWMRDRIESGKALWPDLPEDRVIVSGVNTSDLHGKNYASFNPKHLMPLPPLPEEELAKDKELELV